MDTMDKNNNQGNIPEGNNNYEAMTNHYQMDEQDVNGGQIDSVEFSEQISEPIPGQIGLEESINSVRQHDINNSHAKNDYTAGSGSYDSNQGANPGFNPGPQYGAPFYTETYRKETKSKNNILVQMMLVSLVSAILGGTVVGVVLQFIAPNVEPYITSFLNNGVVQNNVTDSAAGQNSNNSGYKKVEIQKTDSPISAIAEKVGPSIVGIRVKVAPQFNGFDFFLDNSSQDQPGEGSGIIIRSNGYIMTNQHVIAAALGEGNTLKQGAKIEVILPDKKDKIYTAQVIGADVRTDLAVIKIDGFNFPAVELGDSSKVKVGDLVVAIGNPGGLEYMGSVTSGIVSGLNRTIYGEDRNEEIKLIQTDAAINPGNSGGALLNSTGQVIGINSVKIVSEGYEGLGFAIPINEAKEITDSLIQYKYVKGRPPVLGLTIDTTYTEDVLKQYNVPAGLVVKEVQPFSGAYKAGIQPGDIITKFEGKPVKAFKELTDLKNTHKVGDQVSIEIYRDGQTRTVKVTLGEDRG